MISTTTDTDSPTARRSSASLRDRYAGQDWPNAEKSMIDAAKIVIEGFARRHPGQCLASGEPSLLQLARQWLVLHDQAQADSDRLAIAEAAACRLHPQPGPTRSQWGSDTLSAQAREARDLWDQQRSAIDSSFGIPGLEETYRASSWAQSRFADQILTIPARTPQDAAIKYAIMFVQHEDGFGQIDEALPFRVFLRDLEAIAHQRPDA